MKIVKYSCDLCKEDKQIKDLFCFYFNCGIIPQQYVLTKDMDGSPKHICTDCIKVIEKHFLTK